MLHSFASSAVLFIHHIKIVRCCSPFKISSSINPTHSTLMIVRIPAAVRCCITFGILFLNVKQTSPDLMMDNLDSASACVGSAWWSELFTTLKLKTLHLSSFLFSPWRLDSSWHLVNSYVIHLCISTSLCVEWMYFVLFKDSRVL